MTVKDPATARLVQEIAYDRWLDWQRDSPATLVEVVDIVRDIARDWTVLDPQLAAESLAHFILQVFASDGSAYGAAGADALHRFIAGSLDLDSRGVPPPPDQVPADWTDDGT